MDFKKVVRMDGLMDETGQSWMHEKRVIQKWMRQGNSRVDEKK